MGSKPSFPTSQPIEGTKEKGFSHIYRNSAHMDKLISISDSEYSSLRDLYQKKCLREFKDRDFIGQIKLTTTEVDGETKEERTLRKWTYSEAYEMAMNLGAFIINKGLQFNEKERGMKTIGIFSKNRYQWLITDVTCCLYGFTLVPLYETLGKENISYCLEHSEVTTCFCNQDTLKTLLTLKNLGNLKNIVTFDPISKETEESLKNMKLNLFNFSDALKPPSKPVSLEQFPVNRETILAFSYTSGTTGQPKAALISHGNLLCFVAAAIQVDSKFMPDDVYLSYLPLPHIMERLSIVSLAQAGAFIIAYSGDFFKIVDDSQFVKPTMFVGPPRLYNRLAERVKSKFNEATGVKKCILNCGVNSKTSSIKDGDYKSGIYDPILFSKVRDVLGGRVEVMLSGGAPIKPEVAEFMKVIMCCPLLEGYGQTECTGAAFVQDMKDPSMGNVGAVAGCLEFKLMDIPEMNYTSDDKDSEGRSTPRGEIWVRGDTIFKGYYKDKAKTEEAVTSDGWLRTGDVGMLLPENNAMKIIDRKKNIFKLQQGEYVAAEKVQGIYCWSNLVSETFLYGDSYQNFAVAVVTVDKAGIEELAAKHSIKKSFEEVCKDKLIRTLLCKEMNSVGKEAGLMGFQQAKNIYIETEPLFMNKGILSSTMKMQRQAAKKLYSPQIEKMYEEGPLDLK